MKLSFDYYHNLERVELYLCNPDGRELFPLPGKSRNLTLRFNDLSELTFEVDSKITLSDNTIVDLEAYDYIQTKRLVFATNIGWFQISGVDEHDNGVVKYKTVKTESFQSVLKNKGFISEERVYCFYNPNDPHDDRYDSTNEDSIPSVLGQWSKQLGIKQALGQGLSEPATPYDEWTVTYVHSSLIYAGSGSKCRTFKESVTYGYDWIVNDVEEAFEVVIIFDFMYKTIHVMTPNEAAQRVNVIYTFNNFMKSVDINEASEDIVTVLNCNGDNCDITAVNPTGTNYICDFSYYMDKTNYRWMSSALITKLEQWKAACDAEKDTYTDYVSRLRSLWLQKTECTTSLQEMSLSLQDLKNAQNKRSVVGSGTPGALCGIVAAESVRTYRTKVNEVETVIGGRSIKSGTDYYSTDFTGAKTITAYQYSPTYNAETKKWVFSGASKRATADSIVADNLSDSNTSGVSYWYFSDVSDGSSYCKLQSAVTVNKDSVASTYYCGGFDRYIAYSYPIVEEGTGVTTYTDSVQEWINLRESIVSSLNSTNSSLEASINSVSASLDDISSRLNILSYFASTPALLRELNCYWIEGDYTNDNIAVLEETTPEEEIDLSNELLDAGYIELSKVCQPRFSFSLDSVDATKQYEFKDQMRLLELGKIITIEKEEGLWYYPALLEISMNLDNSEEFSMTFANAMRLDDWGYTYADLISDASSTSRKVSANWQDILAYSKERAEISSLIKDPLDTTLRASFANMVNQEFTVDKNGILGRKKVSEASDEFEDEQVRLINNLLIFTDDNWQTAKTALGKITYKDGDSEVTSYGLIAETIIGSLLMGERLKIKNSDSSVEIGAEGISIKRADGTVVFHASNDGDIKISNYATSEELSTEINNLNNQITLKASQTSVDDLGNRITDVESELTVEADWISATIKSKLNSAGGNTNTFGWSLTADGFYIASNGNRVFSVDKSGGLVITGKITALAGGKIGGWDITTYGIQNTYNGLTSGFEVQHNTTNALAIGSPDANNWFDAPFRVTHTGELHATGAVISGTITATSGSIGTGSNVWNIGSNYMYCGNTKVIPVTYPWTSGSNNTYLGTDGLFFDYGGSYAGNYKYTTLVSSGHVVTCGDPNASGSAYRGTAMMPNGINFHYFGSKHPNSTTMNNTDYIVGRIYVDKEGKPFIDGRFRVNRFDMRGGYDADGNANGISFYGYDSNTLTYTWGGSIEPKYTDNQYMVAYYGKHSFRQGLYVIGTGVDHDEGVDDGIFWCDAHAEFFKTADFNKTVYFLENADVYFNGDMYKNGSGIHTSDRNKKNSIQLQPSIYSQLFDKLKPVIFKYNYGKSDRYHTGLIAQDVEDTLQELGIDSKDFAALCYKMDESGSKTDYGIRYGELISMCIYEIQRLKKRVAELEIAK